MYESPSLEGDSLGEQTMDEVIQYLEISIEALTELYDCCLPSEAELKSVIASQIVILRKVLRFTQEVKAKQTHKEDKNEGMA